MSKQVVVLFDIDGTMILTGGAGQQAMSDVVAGRTDSFEWREQVTFSGRTDRGILTDLFRLYDIEPTLENFERFAGEFLPVLEEYLPKHEGLVMPVVFPTIETLVQQPQVRLGLLTGNMRRAAHAKLHHYGLADFFLVDGEFVGGFGDVHADRDDVAREALLAVHTHFDSEIPPRDVWVLGDTPNDVKCARAIGARVVALATGQYTTEQLAATQPDIVCEDLSQAEAWWELLQTEYGVEPIRSLR